MARPRGRYACREADRERPRSASSASGTAGRGADSGLRPSCRGTAASGSGGSWSRSWTASAWPAWYDLGDDHRFVGTLCPDMKLTLERPDPEVVTAVTRSADLPREGRELLLDLVDRAKARDAAASWTGRVSTAPARTGWTPTCCASGPTAVSPGPCPSGQDLDATTPVRALGTWSGQPA
ncbi:aromatic-ring hydroxylase C-terminal domain-containing protein [Streptomyces galilaeus]|uniref:aromatic-ring hydroxylase C-terminal domain-containing protein n=1 Tax=Streptomyces galilaeus TaxID=33899 RepID=UPI0038F646C9